MTSYQKITTALPKYNPTLTPKTNKTQAAVAAILHPTKNNLNLLFIERAAHPKDPWSGHIGFPGGTIEPDDADLQHTAERETIEELGLDLADADHLGRLDDVTGATLPVQVACFVYAIRHPVELTPNDEVREVFWTSFTHLADPSHQQTLNLEGWPNMPAIDLLGLNRPLLWGLTYRLVTQLVGFADIDLPKKT